MKKENKNEYFLRNATTSTFLFPKSTIIRTIWSICANFPI